jgi:hypothetical protein
MVDRAEDADRQLWAARSCAGRRTFDGVTSEQELVQLFGVRGRELDALRALAGGVTTTYLRTATLSEDSLGAVVEGLADPNPRIRWWCIQVLDHVPDVCAVSAIASCLDDPVARVRRNAVHAVGCVACKPDWDRALPAAVLRQLVDMSEHDPSEKVRREAAIAVARMT